MRKRVKSRSRQQVAVITMSGVRYRNATSLRKLASALSDAVSLMRGYVGHHGVIERHHPLMQKVTDANQAVAMRLIALSDRAAHRRKAL